jgi:membrane protease YdiL (CAAX protease family)
VTRGGLRATVAIDGDVSATLRDVAKVVGWGLLLYGAVLLIGAKLSTRSVGSLVLQLLVAEWGAGRLAVSWSDPMRPPPPWGDLARRVGGGAAAGVSAACVAVVFAVSTRALSVHANAPEPTQLGLGLFVAALSAARDELLLRGIPLRAFRRACPPFALLLVCGGASAAAEYGAMTAAQDALGAHVLIAGLTGIIFAALWMRDRGGWFAVGAHMGWTFATGGLIRGGLLDLRSSSGAWGGGDAGFAGSFAVTAALVPMAAIALGWFSRHGLPKVD